jgi:hypothetical protein
VTFRNHAAGSDILSLWKRPDPARRPPIRLLVKRGEPSVGYGSLGGDSSSRNLCKPDPPPHVGGYGSRGELGDYGERKK